MTCARKWLGLVLFLLPPIVPAQMADFPTFIRGTYTATVTGCTTAPTITVRYFVLNELAALHIPTVSCTSNATGFTLTGAPVAIRPLGADAAHTRFRGTNNSANVDTTSIRMTTAGTLTMRVNVSDTGWTASGTKGIANSISYSYLLTNA